MKASVVANCCTVVCFQIRLMDMVHFVNFVVGITNSADKLLNVMDTTLLL